ncbi:MAG: Eco47II family restriction endonuclease [Selenomonadaceae bacterium]|nr:Eco47II family restriction endonuclease [Selenomonadaceae bacterium]
MDWNISFITEEQFKHHVAETIAAYGDKLLSYNLEKLNSNLIDPIKMIFDKNVYRESWEELIKSEIFRQRDKASNNDIGYFHQRIFQYFKGCHVPDNGKEGGWDIIYENPDGIALPEGDVVHTIYVEMKNKHNTMNSSAAGKTYIKMQHQLLQDDDCACFLVEAIAKRSQNIKWMTTVDKHKVSHRHIRRVSIDQFYALVTGEPDAFHQICMMLPSIIRSVIASSVETKIPKDTAYQELVAMTKKFGTADEELSMAMAVYLLGFSTYQGFQSSADSSLKDIYQFVREHCAKYGD